MDLILNASGRNRPACSADGTIQRLQGLIGAEFVSEDYVQLCIAVATAQAAACVSLAGRNLPQAAAPAKGPSLHALHAGAVYWDHGILASLFDDLCAALAEAERPANSFGALRSAANAQTLVELAETAAFDAAGEQVCVLSRQLGVAPNVLLFAGRALATPFVTDAAERVRRSMPVGPEPVQALGRCPMCGSAPTLATLSREDGQRILHCTLCGESWAFARLECPFCANRDQHTLGMVSLADDDVYSIETCATCKGYVKTVDENGLANGEEVMPLVVEAATLHLDLVAERDGYTRKV